MVMRERGVCGAGLNPGLDWILACYDVDWNASCDEGESHAWAWREWMPEGEGE